MTLYCVGGTDLNKTMANNAIYRSIAKKKSMSNCLNSRFEEFVGIVA